MTDTEQQGVPDRPNRLRRLAPLLVVLLLTLAFFIPWIFQGKIFLAADILYSFRPWAAYVGPGFRPHNTLISDPITLEYPMGYNRQVKEGGLKKWNPLVLGGGPAIVSVSTAGGHHYLPKILYNHLFSAATAYMMMLITHLLLMGVFMYLYLQEIGAGWRGALFGAAAWMFSGYAMVWFEFEMITIVGTYVPLLLLVMERFLGARRYLYACLGALVLGNYILVQHLQFLLYTGMILLFYFLFLAWRIHRREPGLRPLGHLVACCAITAVGAVLIGSAELLPFVEVILNSSRVARTFDFPDLFNTLGRVFYRHLVTLVFPDYYGSPVLGWNIIPQRPGQEYMNYNELCLYLGVPTLFALIAAAVGWRNAATRFWLLIMVLVATMMVGSYTFYPFFKWFPGLGKVNPTRLIFLFTLAATVTAGLGISALDGISTARRRVFLGVTGLLAASTLLLALVSANPGVIAWFNREYAASLNWQAVSQMLATKRALASPIVLKPLLLTAGAFLLFAAYALIAGTRARLAIFALILSLLAYDLISFGWYYNTATSPDYLFARTPAIDFIKRQPGVFRVLADVRNGFNMNTLAPFGIEELGGYTSVYPERANRMFSFIANRNLASRFDRWVGLSGSGQWRFYDLMNVRYYLTARGAPTTGLGLRLAFSEEIDVYENPRALPRAFVVHRAQVEKDADAILSAMASPGFDPAATVVLEEAPAAGFAPVTPPPAPGQATIARYGEDRIEIAADLPANGWLVVSNTFFPGWGATIDGKPARLERADCAIMAIPVAAGRHDVVLAYRPRPLVWGRALSLLGIILTLAGVAATGGPALRTRARTLLRLGGSAGR
jgi:hypothetical protein